MGKLAHFCHVFAMETGGGVHVPLGLNLFESALFSLFVSVGDDAPFNGFQVHSIAPRDAAFVIARSDSDVAIPCPRRRPLPQRDCHASLAMTKRIMAYPQAANPMAQPVPAGER
jgi:hypothetical protein